MGRCTVCGERFPAELLVNGRCEQHRGNVLDYRWVRRPQPMRDR